MRKQARLSTIPQRIQNYCIFSKIISTRFDKPFKAPVCTFKDNICQCCENTIGSYQCLSNQLPITTTVDNDSSKSCAYNFEDSGLEFGRMVTVLPTFHPTYKISFEFFVLSAGTRWENIIHFTKDNVNDGHTCNHRQIGLWTSDTGSNRLQLYVSGCVNGAEKLLKPYPIVDMNTWNSIEFGQVHFN